MTERTDREPIYFLYKEGIYGHGVFWIGNDLDEGKRQADRAATLDKDDYHTWSIFRFAAPSADSDYRRDADEGQERVYVGVRAAAAMAEGGEQ
ncbi:MAG: hypothetical protein Q7Q73_05795 [Verrucomicrobiota bacterium JB024]|nr:hypothetical protein [Verrucomicrobiota bacterium JB024]